jgi:hypothetical protein
LVESGNWGGEAWPGPEPRARQRLPRVEDLPAAPDGYDREQVREAFDSFYRHIAQLDSTMRALEAVEVFRDQAGELRRELRALKAAGWTQQPWPSYGSARPTPGLPESLPRFAIEAAFLIVVAVVVAVAGFDRLSIVLVMALAWAIVGVVEWASSRDRFARKPAPPPARARVEPAPPAPLRVVATQPALAAPESWAEPEAAEAAEDELTVIRPTDEEQPAAPAEEAEPVAPEPEPVAEAEPEAAEAEPVEAEPLEAEPLEAERVEAERVEVEPLEAERVEAEPVEAEAEVTEPEPVAAAEEPEPEPQPSRWSWAADAAVERARVQDGDDEPGAPRRRFWQRRKRDEDGYRFDPTQPRHVRVLPPAPSFDEQFPVERSDRVDPWEEELDLSIEEPEGPLGAEPERDREPAYAEIQPDAEPDR